MYLSVSTRAAQRRQKKKANMTLWLCNVFTILCQVLRYRRARARSYRAASLSTQARPSVDVGMKSEAHRYLHEIDFCTDLFCAGGVTRHQRYFTNLLQGNNKFRKTVTGVNRNKLIKIITYHISFAIFFAFNRDLALILFLLFAIFTNSQI